MLFIGTLAAVLGFAMVGALVGYGLGVLAGGAWVAVMHTSSFEGYSGMLVFLGFGPVGAIIGALVLPGLYLVIRARRPGGPKAMVMSKPTPRRRSF